MGCPSCESLKAKGKKCWRHAGEAITCPNGLVVTRAEVTAWRLTMEWWRIPLFPDDDVEALRAGAPGYLRDDPDVFPPKRA